MSILSIVILTWLASVATLTMAYLVLKRFWK